LTEARDVNAIDGHFEARDGGAALDADWGERQTPNVNFRRCGTFMRYAVATGSRLNRIRHIKLNNRVSLRR
jgi:hypothetical protein